jgi:hypothetical protein
MSGVRVIYYKNTTDLIMKKIFFIIVLLLVASFAYSEIKFDGFGNIKWGSSISDVKGGVIGKIAYTDDKKVLVSKDGDIEYLYGFFYKGPESGDMEIKPETKEEVKSEVPAEKGKETGTETKETKLFYVSVKFPYLSKEEVKKKLEEKYGPATGEDIKDNKGAMVWASGNTTIIMWVDSYEKKPFCMKINYLSVDIAKEVNNYQRAIFSSREIEVLKRLSL